MRPPVEAQRAVSHCCFYRITAILSPGRALFFLPLLQRVAHPACPKHRLDSSLTHKQGFLFKGRFGLYNSEMFVSF